MNKSLATGIFATLLIIGGLVYYFYNTEVGVPETQALEAVPDDAALVFEINDVSQSWANLYNSVLWQDLMKSDDFNQFSNKMLGLDSAVFNNSDFRKVLGGGKLFFSIHPTLSGRFNYLYVLEPGKMPDLEDMDEWLMTATGKGFSTGARVFNKVTIHELLNAQKRVVLAYTVYENLLIVSETGSLVDDALRKMISGPPERKKIFTQVRGLATPNMEANVYINYATLGSFLRCFTNLRDPSLFSFLSDFASTTGIDLRINSKEMMLTGVTNTGDSSFCYLDLFRQQQAQKNTIATIVPASTACMLHLGIGQYTQFGKDLQEYLISKGQVQAHRKFSDSLSTLYGIRIEENLLPVLGNEAALVMNESSSLNYAADLYAVIKTNNINAAVQSISNIRKAVAAKASTDSLNLFYEGYPVCKLPLGNFLKLFYDGPFQQVSSPFVAAVGDFLVMANTYSTLKNVIDQYRAGNTLASDSRYRDYAATISGSANVSLFLNVPRLLMYPSAFGSEGIISSISRNQAHYKKFEFVTLQFSSTSNKLFYTSFNFRFNPVFKEETHRLLNAQIDTTAAIKPVMVYDAEQKQYAVMVQDVLNTLYFINQAGQLLWDKKLNSRIMSDIYEVDAMDNGQRQYLFNTEEHVYLVDAKGNNMLNYPVKLGGRASAGLTLCQPDSGGQRFYVPCENQNVYGFSVKGKLLDGWNPRTLEYNVKYSLRTFKLGKRTFLYSSTERGTPYIWQLKGLRAPFNFRKSNPFVTPFSYEVIDTGRARLYALDSSGYVVSYAFGNKSDSIVPFFTGSGNYLAVLDADKDGKVEFLTGAAGSYKLTDNKGQASARFEVDDPEAQEPFLVEVEGKTKIGIVSPKHAKVYLFHHNGSACTSFPISGVTSFSAGDFYQNGNQYIVVGDKGGFINLYLLK